MNITIHRGTREIGGSCVELEDSGSRILIDFGIPLVNQNQEQFDSKLLEGKSVEVLRQEGILPNIEGLYGVRIPDTRPHLFR